MNKVLKRLLSGLIIWFIPFIVSMFLWDVEANAPSITLEWFNAIMAFTWSIAFAIAAYNYFKNIKQNFVKEGMITGFSWYLQLLILDYLFLVLMFGMEISMYMIMFVVYLNTLVISTTIGYILNKK